MAEWPRVKIDREKRQIIQQMIDDSYLGFKGRDASAIAVYALAKGLDNPSKVKNADGWIRPESFGTVLPTLMVAAKLGDVIDQDLRFDEELNENKILEYSEQCINTGLDIIYEEMNENPWSINAYLKAIEDLQCLYDELFEE